MAQSIYQQANDETPDGGVERNCSSACSPDYYWTPVVPDRGRCISKTQGSTPGGYKISDCLEVTICHRIHRIVRVQIAKDTTQYLIKDMRTQACHLAWCDSSNQNIMYDTDTIPVCISCVIKQVVISSMAQYDTTLLRRPAEKHRQQGLGMHGGRLWHAMAGGGAEAI